MIVQALAEKIKTIGAGFFGRAARSLGKLAPDNTQVPATRRAATRSEPSLDWYRFPPF
jgi:hypothetical protein